MRPSNGIVEKLRKNRLTENEIFYMDNKNCVFPNTDSCVLYQDANSDIDDTFESVPNFMKSFPKEELIRDWHLWKMVGDIDMERVAYLLSVDRILEEELQ